MWFVMLSIISGQGEGSVPDHRFEVIFDQSTLSEEAVTTQGFPFEEHENKKKIIVVIAVWSLVWGGEGVP